MRKFFVEKNQVKDNIIKIINEDVNHIKNVLRLELDALIQICDGEKKYISKIKQIEKDIIICEIIEEVEGQNEATVKIDIFQGLPKSDKMEYIIQKCTELGVNEYFPISMKRSIVKLSGKDEEKKILRWQKIAEGAAKQSGRDIIPKINNLKNIDNVCKIIENYDIFIVAYELEDKKSLKESLKELNKENINKIAVLIGPEGGIEEDEIELLKKNGAKVVSLGKRILRTETVALVVSSIIMYEFNELGGI